jgi:hypothetical protein
MRADIFAVAPFPSRKLHANCDLPRYNVNFLRRKKAILGCSNGVSFPLLRQ